MLSSLTEALITCQTGYCSCKSETTIGPESRRPGWRRLLHLNIHPTNILLDDADDTYPFYQRPVLGNWDSAIALDPNLAKRKVQMQQVRYTGMPYWQAPEMCAQYKNNKKYVPGTWDLDHATDVYGVGLVIRYMMLCQR